MVKWLVPVLLIAAGVCVSAGGLVYGVVTVGVPGPDVPPAVAARDQRNMDVSFRLVVAGAVVESVGAAGLAGVAVARAGRRSTSTTNRGRSSSRAPPATCWSSTPTWSTRAAGTRRARGGAPS